MTELLRVMPMSIQDLLDDELESDSLKAAIGAGGVRDIRQGPRSGGTTFVLLHHLVGARVGIGARAAVVARRAGCARRLPSKQSHDSTVR